MAASAEQRRQRERWDRATLAAYQLEQLNRLLDTILPHNRFYARKLSALSRPVHSLDELSEWPCTTKEELTSPDDPLGGTANRTWPIEHYVRYHRTSGTRGRPLVILDTASDWQWWLDGWQYVLDAAYITSHDRVLMAFSFGPFIGFWSAFDAVTARGALTIPTGGLSTLARLDVLATSGATAVFCTPSYALHLAEVAQQQSVDLRSLGLRAIVVAGEPGGSIPAIRQRIEEAWGARVVDHAGASEVGPWGYAGSSANELVVNEGLFIAEFLVPGETRRADPGQIAELVLTTLGRDGAPVVRYRTGDLVRTQPTAAGDVGFTRLPGGVLGRADDMLIVRGVNVFPSSLEQILREFPDVVEYRLTVRKDGVMDALEIEVEDRLADPSRIAAAFEVRLGLRTAVVAVPLGSLPRFEGKGKRLIDRRTEIHADR